MKKTLLKDLPWEMGPALELKLEQDCNKRSAASLCKSCVYIYIYIRVRGEPSERLIPSLGVEMGLGGSKFFIISFAGPRAGPLYFDTQAPRRPRPTCKVHPASASRYYS